MKVWGIGFNWRSDSSGGKQSYIDKSAEFIKSGIAVIGWSEDQAPALYAMANEIKSGDIIYLKSYVIRGSKIRVRAIGIVTDDSFTDEKYPDNKVLKVNWINTSDDKIQLSKTDMVYNVYRNTLYREYSPNIIDYLNRAIGNKNCN